ncbi:MAG TPA: YgjP-like metallopeptidase domain-containing protein, partial [Clostridia bacterium]|nr:YgjP-like metallopeptidase domain-containing protein [Clostridia bacterium]
MKTLGNGAFKFGDSVYIEDDYLIGKCNETCQRIIILPKHAKVFRDLKVVLSVPTDVPDDWIINFIEQRKGWITKQLTKYKQSSVYNNLANIKSGTSTQLLGKDRRIIKKESLNNYVEEDEKKIILYLKDI